MIEVRELPPEQIDVIGDIDRSEHIDTLFEMHEGVLSSRPADIDVPRWNRIGDGPHSVRRLVADLEPILRGGATLLAAVDGDRIVGVAIVDVHFESDMAWLAFLHVSRDSRRRGVGSALWDEAIRRAGASGASTIYVSATPSGSAVGFYRSHGCELANPPHPELFADEPEDVHLVAFVEGLHGDNRPRLDD